MTNERAIEILDPEHRGHYESIEPMEQACRIGIKAIKRVKELEAENAELRATLSKMETVEKELRERLGKAEAEKSKLTPYIEQDNDGDYLVYRAEYILQYIIDSICRTPEAALARLAELKGGKDG